MTKSFPWYDSQWLRRYVASKDLLAKIDPKLAEQFVESMQILRTPPDFQVQHLKTVFDEPTWSHIRETIRSLQPSDMELHEMKGFGRWVVHDHPVFNALQEEVTEMVSRLAGEPLESSYNFLSMYTKRGHCPAHMDAPQAKWTLDICINQSEPWDIHFSQVVPWPEEGIEEADWQEQILADRNNQFSTFALSPGEAILFSGSSQWHYRMPLPDSNGKGFCDLLFFHFIPVGTGNITHEENWPALFGLPELEEIVRN